MSYWCRHLGARLTATISSPQLPDRERVILPFKIAGLIGAYNVFALVRGGGSTGQSGALSLAIAKALATHAPDVEPLLRKGSDLVLFLQTIDSCHMHIAKLLRRDPRMVERKKTGRKGARADVCRTSQFISRLRLCPSVVQLGQAVILSGGWEVGPLVHYARHDALLACRSIVCSLTTVSCRCRDNVSS